MSMYIHTATFCLFQVSDLSELERDQLVCVSPNRQFLMPKEARQEVEVKANWGRARKKFGPSATDVIVSAKKQRGVGVSDNNSFCFPRFKPALQPDIPPSFRLQVDPFGPSTITTAASRSHSGRNYYED